MAQWVACSTKARGPAFGSSGPALSVSAVLGAGEDGQVPGACWLQVEHGRQVLAM